MSNEFQRSHFQSNTVVCSTHFCRAKTSLHEAWEGFRLPGKFRDPWWVLVTMTLLVFFHPKILRESSGKYMCSNLLTLKMLSTNSFTLTFMVLVVDWLVGLLVGCGRGRNCGCLCLLSLSFVCFFVNYCMFCFVLSGCSLACLGFFVGWLLSLFLRKIRSPKCKQWQTMSNTFLPKTPSFVSARRRRTHELDWKTQRLCGTSLRNFD